MDGEISNGSLLQYVMKANISNDPANYEMCHVRYSIQEILVLSNNRNGSQILIYFLYFILASVLSFRQVLFNKKNGSVKSSGD